MHVALSKRSAGLKIRGFAAMRGARAHVPWNRDTIVPIAARRMRPPDPSRTPSACARAKEPA
jgi:hypothetical protein